MNIRKDISLSFCSHVAIMDIYLMYVDKYKILNAYILLSCFGQLQYIGY